MIDDSNGVPAAWTRLGPYNNDIPNGFQRLGNSLERIRTRLDRRLGTP